MEKLISIIVPVYNAEKYLSRCIESVLAQTYKNFELILVDDGSKDKSGEICEEFSRVDGRIKTYRKLNGRQLETRIYGIERASGEYCVFVDSDDWLENNALEVIMQNFSKYNTDVVVYEYQLVKGEQILFRPKQSSRYPLFLDSKREIWLKMLCEGKNSMCCKAVKRSLLGTMDFSSYYDITQGEDLIHSVEVYKNAKSCVFINDVLYNYRANESSISNKKEESTDNLKGDFRGRQLIIDVLRDEKVFEEDDFETYRYKCIEQFVGYIIMVAQINEPINKKIIFYKKVSQTKYYNEFLNKSLKKHILSNKVRFVFSLFQKQRYRMINFIVKLKYLLKNKR